MKEPGQVENAPLAGAATEGAEDFTPRFAAPTALADGAMGRVFKADDPRLERAVAVKVLLREAKATGSLEHPNIPPVYEYGETPAGRPYIALKLIEGQTVAEVIEKLAAGDAAVHQEFPFHRRVQIAISLCDVLEYAHERGLVHRDVKPENVMLGSHGEVWLVDWGLAVPPSEDRVEEPTRLTQENSFAGTMATAAPEQLVGVYSASSDQYSLGVLLYELFALRSPYEGASRFERMTAMLQETPRPAESFVPPVQGRVPREISVLIQRMLEKTPEKRFDSIKTVREELDLIQGGDIRAICPHTFLKKSSHRLGRLMDTHNLWLAPIVVVWVLYPIIHWLYLLVGKLTAP